MMMITTNKNCIYSDPTSCIQVLVTENPKSFSHFITNVCAIIGGVFTVSIFVLHGLLYQDSLMLF